MQYEGTRLDVALLGRCQDFSLDLTRLETTDDLKLAPNDSASHAEMGEALSRQSKFELAVPHYRRAVELDRDNVDYKAMFASASAMSARTRDQYSSAQQLLTDVSAKRPEDEGLHFTLGLLHLRFGSIKSARKELDLCVTLVPNHAEGWYNLGMAQVRDGDQAASKISMAKFQKISDEHSRIISAEKKVTADTRNALHRAFLAETYRSAENYVGAFWQYWTAAKLQPQNEEYTAETTALKSKLANMGLSANDVDFKPGSINAPGPPPPLEFIPKRNTNGR